MFDTIRRPSVQQRAFQRHGSGVMAAALMTAASCALGCSSSQVAPDYAGEPLAVLRGALAADAGLDAAPVDGMTVGLVWLVSSPDGQKSPMVAETAHTEGEFPFGFTLTVFSPPSSEAQSSFCPAGSCDEPELSPLYIGLVAALDDRADLEHVTALDILGASLDHGVLYFERDANPDDPTVVIGSTAAQYNVPAVRGYHLYTIEKDQELYAAMRRCEANGLCVQNKVGGGASAQYWPDRAFEECLTLVPDAVTCTSYPQTCRQGPSGFGCTSYFDELGVEPTPAELAEGERCDALSTEHWPPPECGELERPWRHPANSLGFDASVSIRLGAGVYEFMN